MLNKSAAAFTLGATVIGLALSGCATPAPITASPTSSPTAEVPLATPTPTPTSDPETSAIILSPTHVSFESSDGTQIDSFDLFLEGEGPRAAEGLEELLGSPDGSSETVDSGRNRTGTALEWEGLVLTVYDKDTAQFPILSDLSVKVTSTAVSGISLRTESGISIGGPLDDDADDVFYGDDGAFLHARDAQTVDLEGTGVKLPGEAFTGKPIVYVWAVSKDNKATILETPVSNFGVPE